ncbi:uncharacterized protein UTRI_04220 [Ustilago trichophora]|uniref:Uncharacterized protein n=1 Tax=Ustilago trichophora TaxID=86804 RepID=A0A5C3ERN6_9BASI|nr:uncharacterized protein UTRI_04220 [Ustilago trichophora]
MTTPHSPALSTTSSTASTTATVIDSHPNPKSLINLGKQLKYLSIGLVLTLYFQVYQHLTDALSIGISSSSSAKLALLSIGLLAGTLVIFTYVILLPARGYSINYVDWRADQHLATAIPLLTACIIFGWTILLITLSPIGAPPPPAQSIRQRLAQAATFTGLENLQSRIASLPSSYFPSSSINNPSSSSSSLSKLANVAFPSSASDRNTWDRIASHLSITIPNAERDLHSYFIQITARADEWAARNIKVMGWTGAILGSIGTYLTVFGTVGLIGFLAPDTSLHKSKTF